MLRNRIGYFNMLAAMIVLFIFYHNFFFCFALILIALLPFISYFLSKRVWQQLEVKAEIPLMYIGTGNDVNIKFTVKNDKYPMPGIRAEYTVDNGFYPNKEIQEMSLPLRKGTHSYDWSIKSVYAGRIRLTGKTLKMQDFLGLYVFTKEWDCEAAISAIPPESDIIMDIIEEALTNGNEQDNDSGNAVEDVTQIKEFREYIPGDRLQRVNWKISAKHDNLFVKVFEMEYNRTLTLLVELYRDSDSIGFLDEVITAFYSAALKMIDLEMRFNVQWYDVESGRFVTEIVEEPDGLMDAIQQMYLASSYTEYHAYEKYKEAPHKPNDMTVYFTSPNFGGYDDSRRIGTYKERVAIICL